MITRSFYGVCSASEEKPARWLSRLFWLALGFTLAWSKGSHTVGVTNEEKSDTGVHEWIGIQYALRGNLAVMSLLAPFVTSACRPFTPRRCFESIKLARCAVGKAARVAKLYQKRRLFAGALWALSGSFHAATKEKPEGPVGKVAVARFRVAAAWFGALLQGESSVETLFRVERIVHTVPESVKYLDLAHAEFDASPW